MNTIEQLSKELAFKIEERRNNQILDEAKRLIASGYIKMAINEPLIISTKDGISFNEIIKLKLPEDKARIALIDYVQEDTYDAFSGRIGEDCLVLALEELKRLQELERQSRGLKP